MTLQLQDSIVLITSSDDDIPNFGTGFAVYKEQDFVYIVTCSHVIRDVTKKNSKVLVSRYPSETIDIGSIDGPDDIAILRVKGLLNIKPLTISLSGKSGYSILIKGFQSFDNKYLIKEVKGKLGKEIGIEGRESKKRIKAWDLDIHDQDKLQLGYSGSPIICEKTKSVLGIVSHRIGIGDKGVAISIANIKSVWLNMPDDLIKDDILLSTAVRINVAPWIFKAEGISKFPDRVIKEQEFIDEDSVFKSLGNLLRDSLISGLTIELYNERNKTIDVITELKEFWIMLISSMVLDSAKPGSLKWLINETVKEIRENNVSQNSMIYCIWEYICQRYCDHLSKLYRPELIDNISKSAIDLTEKTNHNFLYHFFMFFYDRLEKDTLAIQKVAKFLETYDNKLGNDAIPSYLERLKYLIGVGYTRALENISSLPQFFKPELVIISESKYCEYKFHAMVYPLTVFEYSIIRRVLPKILNQNPSYPYIFPVVSKKGISLFNLLSSEIESICNLCTNYEEDDLSEWDVPTICEWLALADCEDRPYPWGTEQPTKHHANLDFGMLSKLRPVGAYPLGVSKYSTNDCCGNVHEIVRISDGNHVPYAFRLAGGCYQTNVHLSSCQIVREFKTRKDELDNELEEYRQNVGLRLIRYKKENRKKRFMAMNKYMRKT